MGDKPAETGEDRLKASPEEAPEISGTNSLGDEKYKGSREAARRSRARYSDSVPKRPFGEKGSSGRGAGGLLMVLVALAILVAAGVWGLDRAGVFDLEDLTRVAENKPDKPRSGPDADKEPASAAPAPSTPTASTAPAPTTTRAVPTTTIQSITTTPSTATTTTLAARPAEQDRPADPLRNLVWLKQKLVSGGETVDERTSFEQECFKILASARDNYVRGLIKEANQTLADLDRVLDLEFVKLHGKVGELILRDVRVGVVKSDQGRKALVIQGAIQNKDRLTRGPVLVRADLKDKDDRIIAKTYTLAGRTLDREGRFRPWAERARILLDASPDRVVLLRPGSEAPVMAVFGNPPPQAKRYAIRVVLAPGKDAL